ncbi:MAG: O-antigen ligase family protein [Alphaproteobacteria bacterium]
MFSFRGNHLTFETAGFLLLSAYIFVFVFALSPFQAGTWLQTEPTLLAVFILAACSALWLFWGNSKQYLNHLPTHLFWKLLIGWILVQCIFTINAPSIWRAWFGPAEIGIGTAWHICVLLCVTLMYPFWQKPSYRNRILLLAIGSMLLESLLHYLYSGEFIEEWSPWRPALWPDYMAFTAGYLWIAAQVSGHAKKPAMLCLMIVIMYVVLLVSQNLVALALFGVAMLVTTLGSYPRYPRALQSLLFPSRMWRNLAIFSCLIPLLWVIGSPLVHQLPQDDVDIIAGFAARGESMGSRAEINQIAINTLLNEPSRLLFGKGWGHFTHDSFKYALVEGVHVFENGKMAPNSNNISGASFHSHSEPLEILLALGISGLLVWLAIPFLVIARIPSPMFWGVVPMFAAIVMLQYFWFSLPQVLAFQAIALCALCSIIPPDAKNPNSCQHTKYIFLALFALMGWSAFAQYKAIQYGEELFFIPRSEKAEKYNTEWIARDISRDATRLNAAAENFALWAWKNHFRERDGMYDQQWYANFLDVAQSIENSETLGARYNMLALWLKYKLFLDFTDDAHSALRKKAAGTVEASIYRLTRVAPQREDLAAIFLVNLADYTNNNAGKQVEILGNILNIYPSHRSALWLLGHIFLTDPAYAEEGKRMIGEAKARHVERVYPVTDAELSK